MQSSLSIFYLESNVFTIDPLVKNRRASIRGRFILDRVVNVSKYIESNFIDLCQFNGVYGWGINTESELRASLISIHAVMKSGAVLIFGHNLRTHNPLALGDDVKTASIFNNCGFDELKTSTLSLYLDNYYVRVLKKVSNEDITACT